MAPSRAGCAVPVIGRIFFREPTVEPPLASQSQAMGRSISHNFFAADRERLGAGAIPLRGSRHLLDIEWWKDAARRAPSFFSLLQEEARMSYFLCDWMYS